MRCTAWVLIAVAACGHKRDRAEPGAGPGSGGSAVSMAYTDAAPGEDAARVDANLAPIDPLPASAAKVRPLWSPDLKDEATFLAYSRDVGGERFAKLVIDLKTDRIYYFDVNVYPVHADFVFAEIYGQPRTPAGTRAFAKNYTANKDLLLCSISHHLAQDEWTFAFWPGDQVTAEQVRRAFKRMAVTFYQADRLKFRPDSTAQEAVARVTGEVPFVLNDQLYHQATFQVFNPGRAVGTLRIIASDADVSDLAVKPDEIVVLPVPVPDLSPVAGIVAETFGSPLAHAALRARGWGIPNVGVRDASKTFADLAGKPVVLEVEAATYSLRAATDAEVAAAAGAAKPVRAAVVMPVPDLDATALEELASMDADDVRRYGAKAANLGVIAHSAPSGFRVPAGFGVPYHYYAAHLKAAGADALIAGLATTTDTKRALAAVKAAILRAPLDPALCTAIEGELAKLGPDVRVFVRSSFNAEDLATFSGAGLQETVPNVHGGPAVCAAIKTVWASPWTIAAYQARALAGIESTAVLGGVLVQLGVEATAAGVMVTTHPSDPTDTRSVTIDAKAGLGYAVVDGRQTPERLLVDGSDRGIRVLSRSSEPTLLVFDPSGGIREQPNPSLGKPVLSPTAAVGLANAAHAISALLGVPRLDIEWAAVGEQLYIVQARPLVGG